MISSILACTDGSPHASIACDYACRIAGAHHVPLTGIHILDIRMIEGAFIADISGALGASGYFASVATFRRLAEEKGNTIEKAFLALAGEYKLPASFIKEAGIPLYSLLKHHKQDSLLVIGRCGENESFAREYIGSTTERLIRRTSSSCLVTPSRPLPITRILAACDNSPISPSVATTAATLSLSLHIPLTLLTVPVNIDHGEARQILMNAEVAASAAGCSPDAALIRDGEPADVILSTATDEHCDLIVMGAHSHSRIREWFVGCTTLRVLADSALPALLVR